jgi:hypothetical protein
MYEDPLGSEPSLNKLSFKVFEKLLTNNEFVLSLFDENFFLRQITITIIKPITRTPPTTDNEIIIAEFPFSDEDIEKIEEIDGENSM